ncbi:MAG TPA: methyltransferase domain-containing protein [Mycobacterium sp.]|uniref:class I SAM-dependent methyltransferase n=1 Tax=Mycobacterium sp. TaxID=1785 RepID=UPI002D27F51A|nr:methyltransferase domain-containing protein [Mycobacterium sp.]HZU48840.1 methyltransferase domain-containing protein [Mycobacterium sp.]
MPEVNTAEESLRQWSAVASAWDRDSERLFKDVRSVSEWLVDQVDPQPGQTVLELTAGPGETGFLAAPRLGSTGRLISSDFVPAMVEAARRRAGERGLDNVECRVLDATQIDLPDDCVDGVLSRFGMMLVPAQQRAIAEIRRVLRQGGRCAYATWGLPEHNPWIFQIIVALLQNGVTPPGDPFAPGGIFSLATSESNRALLAGGGFTDITVEELTGTMVFDGPDDYWTHITAVAGPVAELVDSLDGEQVNAIRSTLDPSLAPFETDGALELPWLAVVTSAA